METFTFRFREPNRKDDKEDIEAMEQYLKDGTVTKEYLRRTLGDQSIGVSAFGPNVEIQKRMTGKSQNKKK